ncbi:hypothetical protein DQ04_02371040 [Trypanosoma grayi]|uniref:hypothetical protein n=1 Tax=Trypanosoma grayi TaxID=71804 RepID=UPI0004F4A570|nr:hypothetical protein DQ04_02371040 [Trypanosoma grayi]KEG11681.1 hypothetical protein DQ04_02371040 [Trypanosoma grayi]
MPGGRASADAANVEVLSQSGRCFGGGEAATHPQYLDTSSNDVVKELELRAREAGFHLERFVENKAPISLQGLWTWIGTVLIIIMVGAAKKIWRFPEGFEDREASGHHTQKAMEQHGVAQRDEISEKRSGASLADNPANESKGGLRNAKPIIGGDSVRGFPAVDGAKKDDHYAFQNSSRAGPPRPGAGMLNAPQHGAASSQRSPPPGDVTGLTPPQAPFSSSGGDRHAPPLAGPPRPGAGMLNAPQHGAASSQRLPPRNDVAGLTPPQGPFSSSGGENDNEVSPSGAPDFPQHGFADIVTPPKGDFGSAESGEFLGELQNLFLQRWS